jgi:hypothetical protein
MAEEQARHRQALETSALQGNTGLARRGQLLGFILALVLLVGGVWLIHEDKAVSGLLTVAIAIGGVIGTAWYGKKSTLEELRQKLKELEGPSESPPQPPPPSTPAPTS